MSFLPENITLEDSSVVCHIFAKIYELLPHESRMSMVEVEESQLFLSARKALINMASSHIHEEIVKTASMVLDKINVLDNYLILKQRSVESLSSILITLRLLSDLCKVHWDSKEPHQRKASIDSNQSLQSITSVVNLGIGSENSAYHTVQPDPLSSAVAKKAILLVSRFKSITALTQELSLINGKIITSSSIFEDPSTRPIFEEIDANCAAITRFLAASNPADFFEFTVSKLTVLKHNISNDGDFAPYLELFSSVYLDEAYLYRYLKQIRVIINSVKKASYRQLVLSFFLKSLRVWVSSRPQQFLNCTRPESNVSAEAESLLDELSQMPDMTASGPRAAQPMRPIKASLKFMAVLLCLTSTGLDSAMGVETKKKAFKKLTGGFTGNKKQKVVSQVLKTLEQQSSKDPSENTAVLESVDFMVSIARIAACVHPLDPQNPAVEFTHAHYDLVARAVVPIITSKPSPLICNGTATELQIMHKMRMNYFTSICMLKPKESAPVLIDILNDESTPLETLNITCSILKMLTASTSFSNANHTLMMKMYLALRKVLIRVGVLVKSNSYDPSLLDDDDASLGKTASSASSFDHYSSNKQLVGIESAQRTSTPSSNNSASTPKADKFKDTAKNLLKHHHSLSHVPVQSSQAPSDDVKGLKDDANISQLSRDVMINALELFTKSPSAYFYSFTQDSVQQKVKTVLAHIDELLDPIAIALKDSSIKLVQAAKHFIRAFCSVQSIPDTADAVFSALIGSALLTYTLAQFIANTSASVTRRRDILEYFVKAIEYRIALYTTLENYSYFEEVRSCEIELIELRSYIEEAALICLSTPQIETYSLMKRAFRAIIIGFEHQDARFVYNRDLYQAIASDTSLITGQVALQKNVRKFLLKVKTPTSAIINFWYRLYDRWFQFANSDYDELTPTELSNFRNYAGCLAAISGVFTDVSMPESDAFTAEIREDINEKIDSFINQQFVMLGDDDLVTRENAKEILASEADQKIYPRIINSLASIIDDLTARRDALTQKDLIIVEHAITLLKSVLANGDELVVFSVSIPILQYVEKLSIMVESNTVESLTILKLRIRMSGLFSKLEQHTKKLVISNAFKVRNKFLRHVYSWFENAVNSTCSCRDADHAKQHSHVTKEFEFIYIDVAIESVKALASLLDGLLLEAPQVLNERELKFSKSSLFSIYFNTFLRALERFSDVESFPVSVRHKVTTVSENIVVCLTNLLKSNVDVGLSYALPIGYYTNLAIRVSFLKVFVSIVESYSALGKTTAGADKSSFLVEIFELVMARPSLLRAITVSCPTNEAPALASIALSLAASMNQSGQMVAQLVNDEILSAMKYSDILRRNSFASRSLSAFGRSIGHNYLISTLRPLLTQIRDSEVEFEVEKIDPDDPDAQQNLTNFMYFLNKLVNVIISSKSSVPIEFRYVCKRISEAVDQKFANSRLIAVGSFIFLRFFCPAIVTPDSERVVDSSNRQTQRKYLLLAKVLQNMANGTISSLRWPLLKSREDELAELNQKITDFLDDLTVIPENAKIEATPLSSVSEGDYNYFHAYIYDHWDIIRDEYIKQSTNTDDILFLKSLSERVDHFFGLAGQPTMAFGYEMPPSITPEANPELYEFMNKYSLRDLGSLVNCPFVHNAFNQDGSHLMVFSYSEYEKVKNADDELLLYRFIQVCSKIWDQKFYFVVDCTGNDGSLLFPRQMMTMLGNFAPQQLRDNCQGVIYYNVSSGLVDPLLDSLKTGTTFQAIGSEKFSFISAMEDRKSIMNLGLSTQSVRIYNDVRVKFTDVSIYVESQGRFEPVSLKIGNEFMQISPTSPRRVKVRGQLKEIRLSDSFKLENISSVAATETTTVPNEMTITFKDGKKIILSSPKFLEIMRLLYFTKIRPLGSVQQNSAEAHLKDSVEDMLGQLFNVIFLGLTSSSHEVRSISFNLLAACQKHFHLDIGRDLAQLHEVYFPRDNNSFVVAVSEKLAQTMPEVTGELIKSFFDVFNNNITPRQRLSAILYVSPWISNLYEHVFKTDDENGKGFVAEIIRNLLSVSTKDSTFLSAFSMRIFSKICLEDRLSEILVDEIVLNAVDREAEGKDWLTSISLLSSTPTVEICGYVIKRLREVTHIPFPNADGRYSLESHSTWTEITVLTNLAVSLFFDSYTFAEMFLPDVFHIITILVDVGPLNLRVACHQLLLNVVQSFLAKKSLPQESRAIIFTTVEHFTSHRSRLLFGLNRDSPDSFETEISKFTNRITTTESLVASLLEVIELAGENNKPIWITRWNRYALDAVCKPDSVLRGRALVLLGILSKGGVSDELVRTVLEYVAEMSAESPDDPKYKYLAICTIFALGKISEGLLEESTLFSKMFWLSIVITHSKHTALFQGGLKFIVSVLETMNIKEKFINADVIGTLMKGKSLFGDMLEKIETVNQIVINEKNFDQVLLYFAVNGLQLPYAKVMAITSLRTFFQVRFMNEMMNASFVGREFDNSSFCYLFFLFIVMKPTEVRSVLNDIDYAGEYLVLSEQVHVPMLLLEFMLSGSDAAYLTFYQASLYFNTGTCNEKTMLRFLAFYKLLGQKSPQMFIRLYPLIRPTLRNMIISSTAPMDVLAEIFDISAIANVMPEYNDFEKNLAILNGLIDRYDMNGIKEDQTPSNASSMSSAEKAQRGFMIKPVILRMIR